MPADFPRLRRRPTCLPPGKEARSSTMSLRYSDLHLRILTRGLLDAGEHLTGQAAVVCRPWWGLGLVTQPFVLVSTDRRLVVLEHTWWWKPPSFVLSRVESVAWPEVVELALGGRRRLRLVASTSRGREVFSFWIPSFGAAIRDNVRASRAVVATFQAYRALPPSSRPRMVGASHAPA
jgi:hypothetical protein